MEEKPRQGYRSFATAYGKESLNLYNACKVVDLQENAGPVVCDLTVHPGKSLALHLQDPDGQPLVGVTATGMDAMGSLGALKTAACPVFALDPEQPRRLAFLHGERKLATLVTVRGDEKEPLIVRLAPASAITGRLLDRDGKPIAGADIVPRDAAAVDKREAERVSRSMTPPRTDKDGRFRLEGLFPGMKINIQARTNQGFLVEETTPERKPLQSGATQDLGDIRVKAQTQ
jgi:hypothetical protein